MLLIAYMEYKIWAKRRGVVFPPQDYAWFISTYDPLNIHESFLPGFWIAESC